MRILASAGVAGAIPVAALSCLVALLGAVSLPVGAQSLPDRNAGVPTLELARDAALGEVDFGAIRGQVDAAGLKLTVGNLSILQPVLVTLIAEDPSREVSLRIFKSDWNEARRTGTTGSEGFAQFRMRTEGAMNLLVEGPTQGAPFVLAVAAGPELTPAMKDIFVATRNAGSASGWPKTWLLIVAAAGALVAVFAVLKMRGRKTHE